MVTEGMWQMVSELLAVEKLPDSMNAALAGLCNGSLRVCASVQLGPNATDVDLWAEIHRLRAAMKGPDGFASWQDAATAERLLRIKTQIAFGRLADVAEERVRQDAKWGGAEHDDRHCTADFVQLIEDYAGWARTMAGMDSHDKAERRLIQVAALSVAAVESSRRRRGV